MYRLILQAGGIDVAGGSPNATSLGDSIVPILVVLGVVTFVGGVFLAIKWYQQNARKNQNKGPLRSQMLNRDTLRRIDSAVAQGQYETAGDLLSRAQQHDDAGEAYAKAGAHLKAARSFHAGNNRAQAIYHYKKAGEVLQAARIYADDGQHRAAAAEYMSANHYELAAEQYARAGDIKRAAENYEKSRKHKLAGEYYEKAEMPTEAAENFELYLQQELKGVDQVSPELLQLGAHTAELLQSNSELQRATTLYAQLGMYKEAADCLRVTGDFARAADMLMQANQPMLAAKILEEAGEARRAAKMRGEAALERGQLDEAADSFRTAGELERAAELYVQLEKWPEAAALYEELESYSKAMELFARSERYGNAARCAESAKQYAKAFDLYEKASDFEGQLRMLKQLGDFFRAGRLLFEHRQFEEALKFVEQIDSRDPLYLKSLELQGDILRGQSRHEKAYSRYKAALGTRDAELGTLHLYYKMARALEDAEDLNGALEHYIYVTDIEEEFEDAMLRQKAVRERIKRSRKPTTSGLFSSSEIGSDGETRYEIIEEIARGGMGIVYKARDTVLGRVVAYKILGENLRDNETAVKYFLREARAAAALSHPNIVTIFDAGEQAGEYYMAMEFVEGTTLKELIRRTGALPEDQVSYILNNSCKALHYAHSKGLVHRDIKSGNVMITRDKTLKIMDFGLAKFLREYQNNHTQQVGTPFYMSPEQIIGKDIDFRSDLYSLGCMLFECATGTVPFFKGDLSYHHLHTPPPTPRSINPVISKELETIILKLLEKDPDERYQSAVEVARAASAVKRASRA